MQSAKDTFYVMLRDRVAGINAARTVVLRGVSRPGLLVAENELARTEFAADVFVMRWAELSIDAVDGLVKMQCEIRYATDGMSGNAGMDRGRLLAELDVELARALRREPQNAGQTDFSAAGAKALSTNIFWADPVFGRATAEGERMGRSVTIEVFAYQEAGGV